MRVNMRGTTLAELLVAVVFLGVCVTSILACVTSSQEKATYAKRRAMVLGLLTDQMELARTSVLQNTIVAGVNTTNPTLTGLESAVTLTQTVVLVGGYTTLYSVTVTATWTEQMPNYTRAETMTLQTYVRLTDA